MHDPWQDAMRRGDFRTAWQIADAVLAARDPATRDDPSLPYHLRWVWDGRPLAGQDVLVRCYHGLGDTVQFARYLTPLRARAARVTLEVQAELVGLLQILPGADELRVFDPAAPSPASCDIEIMELPHALRMEPCGQAYLHAAPGGLASGSTGVCWRAGRWDIRRSITLRELYPALPADAISLQRGDVGLPDPLGGSMDVVAMAELISGLAHVITVDTMIAHLAGALGRPTSILLHHDADWRWGSDTTTPWYNSARLLRQAAPGDWCGPLAELKRHPQGGV